MTSPLVAPTCTWAVAPPLGQLLTITVRLRDCVRMGPPQHATQTRIGQCSCISSCLTDFTENRRPPGLWAIVAPLGSLNSLQFSPTHDFTASEIGPTSGLGRLCRKPRIESFFLWSARAEPRNGSCHGLSMTPYESAPASSVLFTT